VIQEDTMQESRPHVLGVDDAPFEKGQAAPVPIVGVVMSGADQVEGVAIDSFPVDGDGATDFLAGWIAGLRWRPALHAVVLGGITIAGLGLVDIARLAATLELPVIAVTRRKPSPTELRAALEAAGLGARASILERTPATIRVDEGLCMTCAGVETDAAQRLVRSTLGKSHLPEPLRIAHLIGTALVRGTSRGRV
jgi:endonuclease V-like protein UPF0215 family